MAKWDVETVVNWLRESNLGAFEKAFRDNEIDGATLLKLSEAMVVRLFPTIKLEVQFLDLLGTLKQRHQLELSAKKNTQPSSSNGRTVALPSSSFDRTNGYSSNSNSPPTASNAGQSKLLPKGAPLLPPPLKAMKRDPKCFPLGDANENDAKHTFPLVYKLPQFADTLRLALSSQDASAFKLRTYYRNLLISSIYDDLTRTYNLWYPNARQYKTVASALVKSYPFLESSTDGGEVRRSSFPLSPHHSLLSFLRAPGSTESKANSNEVDERSLR